MLTKQDLNNLKELVGTVVTEKLKVELGENFKEKLERIERNTDSACKVAKDADEELTVTQAKVDNHEERILVIESNFASA